MKSKGKYIGISNRIRFVVLKFAVSDFINTGLVNSNEYYRYILEFTKGENRAKKTLGHLLSIINKNVNILDLISKQTNGSFQNLSENDQKAVLLSLYSLTFPIGYDILHGFSVGFKVQDIISKRVIVEKMGAIYGSNRSMHIGVDETIPILLEIGVVKRIRNGIYAKGQTLTITNKLVSELIIYSDIKLSATKSILIDEINFKPWHSYFEITNINDIKFSYLLNKRDSAVGTCYLTILNG